MGQGHNHPASVHLPSRAWRTRGKRAETGDLVGRRLTNTTGTSPCSGVGRRQKHRGHGALRDLTQLKASAPHLVWAAGHFLTFFAGVRYLLTVATFSWNGYDLWYRVAYFGAIISYGVVIYKSFGVPRTDKAYVQRALMDENVQYLVIAIYWCYIKPISSTSQD